MPNKSFANCVSAEQQQPKAISPCSHVAVSDDALELLRDIENIIEQCSWRSWWCGFFGGAAASMLITAWWLTN